MSKYSKQDSVDAQSKRKNSKMNRLKGDVSIFEKFYFHTSGLVEKVFPILRYTEKL